MPFLTPRDATGDPAVTTVEVQRLGNRRLQARQKLLARALLAVHAGDLGNPADPPFPILPSHRRVGVGHPLSPRKHCTTGVPAALANNRNLSYGNALPSPKVPACSTGLTTSAFISCPCRLHIGCSICEVSTRMPATFLRGRRTFTPLRTMRYAECVMRPEHRVRSSPGSQVSLNP
jgi:hypothetical protein